MISEAAAEHEEQIPARRTFMSRERHHTLDAETLAELWNIGLKKTKETMKATTQNGTRSAILPLSRQYRSDGMYNVKRLQGRFATDTFYLKSKSIYGNTYVQIY